MNPGLTHDNGEGCGRVILFYVRRRDTDTLLAMHERN